MTSVVTNASRTCQHAPKNRSRNDATILARPDVLQLCWLVPTCTATGPTADCREGGDAANTTQGLHWLPSSAWAAHCSVRCGWCCPYAVTHPETKPKTAEVRQTL